MEARKEELQKSEGMERSIHCLIQHRPPASSSHNYEAHLHYHEYIELLYGLRGSARAWIGSKSYSLAEGDLLIVNAGEPHDVTPGESDSSYYVIKFLPKLLYTQGQSLSVIRYLLPLWQKQVGFRPALRKADLEESGIDGWVREIRREWEARSPGYELITHANIMQIFVWVLRHCCTDLESTARVPAQLQKSLQIALEKTPGHLEDWTARDAARACGLSYNYFSHTFKQAFGISYTAYLESVRLREAERLLLTTEADITEIAQTVGFGTVSYFIERFRKSHGVSPGAFRRQMQV